MTERSEWQRPAARTRTSTSPGPGGSSSISVTRSGRLTPYGGVSPVLWRTAARVFICAQRLSARAVDCKRTLARGDRCVIRQGGDPLQPGGDVGIVAEIEAALRGDIRVCVQADVGDREFRADEKRHAPQALLEHAEGAN